MSAVEDDISSGKVGFPTVLSGHAICFRELNVVHIGRLYVKPYHYRFETHAKGRWVGRTLLQVFQHEFPYQPQEYFVRGTTTTRATNR